MNLREWLLSARLAAKLTQESVAHLTGISQSAYARIENGNRNPSVPVAKQIGRVLNVQWENFYE